MQVKYQVEGGDFTSAGYASSQVKKLLKQLNVAPKIIKNVVVALYEAEVNIVAHAYRGTIEVALDPQKVTIVLQDEGPGIPNIELAMQEGYSTASPAVREMGFGAGMGLPNIKRNVDDMQLESQVDKGTKLTLVKFFNAQ